MAPIDKLLKTKFFLPKPPSDFVERKGVDHKFDKLKNVPIMLVSSTTGFGKSVLVSNFLETKTKHYTWLSLSEKENDLQRFITYFVDALHSTTSVIGNTTLKLPQSGEFPSAEEIAEILSNDLVKLTELQYFAIDDYHLIVNNEIHEFIDKLFQYVQPYFRLIIISRYDPQLPLSSWRKKNKLIEIRSKHLRFTRDEINQFCQKTIDISLDDNVLSQLEIASEGWISGLRILILSTKTVVGNIELSGFKIKNLHAITDLVNAVLKILPKSHTDNLLKLSLLREFNVELFAELCLDNDQHESKDELFSSFISELVVSNMFIIQLDQNGTWFRFHHFFSDQLVEILKRNHTQKEISFTINRASIWYRENGFPEEAIEKLIDIDEIDKALEIFENYRLLLVSSARFPELESVFNFFSKNVIKKKSILYLTNLWLELYRGNVVNMVGMINSVEQVILQEKCNKDRQDLYMGEVYAIRAYDKYLLNIDMEQCLQNSVKSISLLKNRNFYAYGLAWIFYGGAMQILNKSNQAKKELLGELGKTKSPSFKGQILLTIWYIKWFEGNFSSALRTADQLIQIGLASDDRMLIGHGYCFKGITLYQCYENDKAIEAIEKALNFSKYFALKIIGFPSWMTLAKLYSESGRFQEAKVLQEMCRKVAYRQGNAKFLKIVEAYDADINSSLLSKVEGLNWAKKNDYLEFLPLNDICCPEIIQAKLLASSDEPDSINLANKILEILNQFFLSRNNVLSLIQIKAIRAVVYYKLGMMELALNSLEKAISLSEMGFMKRIYIELGDPMRQLLENLNKEGKHSSQIELILKHFDRDNKLNGKIKLSNREVEILSLSKDLQNKEIANMLFISEKTVKTHITNINKKLKTTNRKEALRKATDLNIL